jgi:hypothetical protein
LQTFGASCYVRAIPTSKLSDRAVQLIFVGYCLNAKGYRLLDPVNLSIHLSRSEDVSFPQTPVFIGLSRSQRPRLDQRILVDSGASPLPNVSPLAISEEAPLISSSGSNPVVSSSGSDPVISSSGSDPVASSESNSQDDSENDRSSDESFHEAMATPEELQVALNEDSVTFGNGRFPKRARRVPTAFLTTVHHSLPKSFQDIRGRPDADEWYKACDQEIMSLHKHGTWTLVNSTPAQSQTLGSLWVFRIKYYADGSIAKYKAQLVARGSFQILGIHFNETEAPVAKHTSLRLLLSIAASEDMEIHQADVDTAFLIPPIEEEVYMRQPPGYASTPQVCKLNKCIYGLKQSNRQWNKTINGFLSRHGFVASRADPCIYIRKAEHGGRAYIGLYVDDLVLVTEDMEAMNKLKRDLKSEYSIKDLGEINYLLGFEIKRNRASRTLLLHQTGYIRTMLEEYNMLSCNPVKTPMDPNVLLDSSMCPQTEDDKEKMKSVPYQAAVGSLLYAALGTRPDIATAVGVVSRFSSNPGPTHWTAVKRIFRYLRGTPNYGITLGGQDTELNGYSDADWAGDVSTRKSTSGYVFFCGNSPISWRSRLQKTVALSTCEAEYQALSDSTKEAVWLRILMQDLNYPVKAPTLIKGDNQGSIALIHSNKHHDRIKHMAVRRLFVRDQVDAKEITVTYCNTKDMVADIMTKALPFPLFKTHRDGLALAPDSEDNQCQIAVGVLDDGQSDI